MKDYKFEFEVNGKKHTLVFNLNVMQVIQEEYGSISAWGALTDRKAENEIDIKALIFGLKEMLNEAIDIENEDKTEKQPFYTSKQVGRIITEVGLKESTQQLNELIVNSMQEQAKNE